MALRVGLVGMTHYILKCTSLYAGISDFETHWSAFLHVMFQGSLDSSVFGLWRTTWHHMTTLEAIPEY